MNLARLPWFGPRPAARRSGAAKGASGRRALAGDERRRRPASGTESRAAHAAATSAIEASTATRALTRPAAPASRDVLQRVRHQPDYAILIAVVALTAIGILMVYSSSALRAYIQQDDTLAIVGPQILWAGVGLLALAVTMRLDYRLLRLVSLPGYLTGLVLLVLVFVPAFNRVVGGSARWIVVGPLPAVHPAEVAKLALIIYLAHWLSNRGPLVKSFRSGTIPFLVIALPLIGLVFLEPDLGTTVVIAVTAFGLFFVAGARIWQFVALGGMGVAGLILIGLRGYQAERIKTFLDPWADPLGAGFHTIQGLLALGLGGLFGSGLGESQLSSGLVLPNAWNDFIFAIIGEQFGFVGAAIVIGLFVVLAVAGIRTARHAPDAFGGLLAAGITIWLCVQAFINIGVVVALLPVTGITLPFVSAGGTSLVVSFAAIGVLLSISRETTETDVREARPDGDRRIDAPADRRRGNGWPHLPGSRGRGRRPAAGARG